MGNQPTQESERQLASDDEPQPSRTPTAFRRSFLDGESKRRVIEGNAFDNGLDVVVQLEILYLLTEIALQNSATLRDTIRNTVGLSAVVWEMMMLTRSSASLRMHRSRILASLQIRCDVCQSVKTPRAIDSFSSP